MAEQHTGNAVSIQGVVQNTTWTSSTMSPSPMTATVSVIPSVASTIPTVNAVPVISNIAATATPTLPLSNSSPMNSAQVVMTTASMMPATTTPAVVPSSLPLQGNSPSRPQLRTTAGVDPTKVLDKQRLHELVREVDPLEQLDDEVEEAICLPTPDLSHLSSSDYDTVYEPAEDTFLLLDALQAERHFLLNHVRPVICLEIGCGSGTVSTFLAQVLHNYPACYFCTDINSTATTVAEKTARQNGVQLNAVVMDLCTAFSWRFQRSVDVLIFNPPYVVTPSAEVGSKSIEAAWAGGEHGREVIDRMLPWVPKLLSKQGVFYMVIIKENNKQEIEDLMAKYGFEMRVVMSRRSGPEFLSILKFVRSC